VTTPPCVDYLPGWIPAGEAGRLLETLTASLPWQQTEITMYGKTHLTPRLVCWIGDFDYTYSGITNEGQPWTPELADLRDRLEAATGARYNSCLANLYRDGRDQVRWHSDDEPELGPQPTIASLSLGAERDFKLKRQSDGEVFTVPLRHGDLIVMRDESQADYRHSIPRRARVTETRVNLTFRWYESGGTS
jgi:alkylated DNA repair dioxygenase AlkB